jgi:Rieske Fe-S protein
MESATRGEPVADGPVVDSPVAGSEVAEDAPALASRRSVLMVGAGAVGLAGALAACGPETAPSGAGGPSAGPTSVPPGEPAASAAASGTAGPGPITIAKSDIPVGGGRIYDDIRVVVTQPTDGTFKAFDSLCTHLGCVVTSVFAGKINCPCHVSQFSVTDGSVIQGPANRGLDKKTVTDNGATITVT